MEYFTKPNTTQPDLGPYLVRPPAIPATLSSQGRKWYSKRMSMSLESGGGANAGNRRRSGAPQSMWGSVSGGNTNNALTMMAAYAETVRKRAEALELVKGLEKKVRVSDGPTGLSSTSSAVAMAAATARRGSTFPGARPHGAHEEIETIEE